jgi:hypothetical protein
MAALVSLVFAAQAFGAATVISLPDAAYQANTTKVGFAALADNTSVTSISDGVLTIGFDQTLTKSVANPGHMQSQWGSWGILPNVETPTAPVLLTAYSVTQPTGSPPQTVVMSLSQPVTTFGFEMAARMGSGYLAVPDPVYRQDVTVTFKLLEGNQVVGVVPKTLPGAWNWNYDARLFAISSDKPFDRVEVAALYPAQGAWSGSVFGQFRYVLPVKTVPTSVPASSGWSIAMTAMLGFTLVLCGRRRPIRRRSIRN